MIDRSENMRRIHSKDTNPELLIRRLIFGLGYRYRLHKKGLPGKPDLVFAGKKKVIFIHGCFWHQHGRGCKISRQPKSNLEYWLPKLERNKVRDIENENKLREAGWSILIIWECQTKDIPGVTATIKEFLDSRAIGSP